MRSGNLKSKHDKLILEFINNENYVILDTGIILSKYTERGHLSKDGSYRELTFCKKGSYKFVRYKTKKISVHRIIYAKFIGSLKEDLVVNHIDGDPSNNTPANLELVPQSVNNDHRFKVLGKNNKRKA